MRTDRQTRPAHALSAKEANKAEEVEEEMLKWKRKRREEI
jgi:hypothetical protein